MSRGRRRAPGGIKGRRPLGRARSYPRSRATGSSLPYRSPPPSWPTSRDWWSRDPACTRFCSRRPDRSMSSWTRRRAGALRLDLERSGDDRGVSVARRRPGDRVRSAQGQDPLPQLLWAPGEAGPDHAHLREPRNQDAALRDQRGGRPLVHSLGDRRPRRRPSGRAAGRTGGKRATPGQGDADRPAGDRAYGVRPLCADAFRYGPDGIARAVRYLRAGDGTAAGRIERDRRGPARGATRPVRGDRGGCQVSGLQDPPADPSHRQGNPSRRQL